MPVIRSTELLRRRIIVPATMIPAMLLVTFFTFGMSASGECPVNLSGSGQVLDNSCYEFFADETTWDEARSYCHSRGGRLAAVTSAALQAWISSRAETLLNGYDNVWIGLNDCAQEGSFVWDNYDGYQDLTSNYTNWKNGEPNNAWFGQNCVFMDRSHDWQWKDGECDLPLIRWNTFICEYNTERSVSSTSSSATTVTLESFATNVAPSEVDVTSASAAGQIKQLSSSTDAVDATNLTNEQLSLTFEITSTTAAALRTKRGPAVGALEIVYASRSLSASGDGSFATNEATREIDPSTNSVEATNTTPHTSSTLTSDYGKFVLNETTVKIDPSMRSVETTSTMTIDYTSSLLSISGDYSFDTNAATVDSYPVIRSAEAITAMLQQSNTNSAGMLEAAVSSHSAPHNTGDVTAIRAAALKTNDAHVTGLPGTVLLNMPSTSSSTKTTVWLQNDSFAPTPASSTMFTVENVSITRPPTSTAPVTAAIIPASDEATPLLAATTETNALATNATAGRTSPAVLTLGTMDSSAEIDIRAVHVLSSLLTSSEGTSHKSAADAEQGTATRSNEATTTFLGHAGDSNEILPAAASSSSSPHDATNTTKIESSAAKRYGDNITDWPGMHIYLNVLAAILMALIIIIAVLVTRRLKQWQPRSTRGIDNPLYGTA